MIDGPKIEFFPNPDQLGIFGMSVGSVADLGIGSQIPIFWQLEVTLFNLG